MLCLLIKNERIASVFSRFLIIGGPLVEAKIEQFRQVFKASHSDYAQKEVGTCSFAYGEVADELADLVAKKIKTGTSSLHQLYAIEKEKVPAVGDVFIVLDGKENPICVIENTAVEVLPFREVTEQHAFLEGEGDRSLAYWRQVHIEFFSEEVKNYSDATFTDDSLIVYETFRVID